MMTTTTNLVPTGEVQGCPAISRDRITAKDLLRHMTGPGISLVLHLTALMILGNIVIFEGKKEPEEFVVSVEIMDIVKPPEQPKPVDPPPEQTNMVDDPTISVDRPVTEVSTEVDVENVNVAENMTTDIEITSPLNMKMNNSAKVLTSVAASPFGTRKRPDGTGSRRGSSGDMLQGVFYDLKQLRGRKGDTELKGVNNEAYLNLMNEFVNSSWKKTYDSKGNVSYPFFNRFYTAPVRLWNSCFYIPVIPAEAAPKAFNCEKEVNTGRWVAIYSGKVVAPVSGKFRFIGSADDVLVVRFNNKLVLDYGYYSPSLKANIANADWHKALEHNAKADPEKLKQLKALELYSEPMKIINPENGSGIGIATGREFEVKAGEVYPIEVLISEFPGGLFHALLYIEEVGMENNYSRMDKRGVPIRALFRTTRAIPATADIKTPTPFDPTGMVWNAVPNNYTAEAPKKDEFDELGL